VGTTRGEVEALGGAHLTYEGPTPRVKGQTSGKGREGREVWREGAT
jgi:hypothetical protein